MATSSTSASSPVSSSSTSSIASAFPQPLPLILTDRDGRFYVVPETAEMLSRLVTLPVVVVAIAGKYRTGKSFLMNRLAGSNSGFSLGCTVQSHTKGIWVWPRDHPLSKDKCLLLIDTEGLGDVESAGRTHDTWLFVMAMLLSTTLVYNLVGTLDKEGLEQLHFVMNMTDHVRTRVDQQEDDWGSDFAHYFPPLVLCMRDFTLKLVVNGEPCTADEYMEHCLQIRKRGRTAECRNFNEQRELLCDYFKDRKCIVFPTPTHRNMLEDIESLPDESLDPEFLASADEFKNHVLRWAKAKCINGAVLTGQSFVHLVEQYVQAQRDGAVPCIQSAADQVTALTNLQAEKAALALYAQRMGDVEQLLPLFTAELGHMHQQAVEVAVELFHKRSLLDRKRKHETELMKALASNLLMLLEENRKVSVQKCERRLEELYEPMRRKFQDEASVKSGVFFEYERMMNELTDSYTHTEGLGDEKENCLMIFMKRKAEEKQRLLLLDKSVSQIEKEKFETEAKQKETAMQMRALEEQNAQQQKHLQAFEAQMKATEKAFEEKIKQVELLTATKANDASQSQNRYMDMANAAQSVLKTFFDFYTMYTALKR